MSLRRTG